MTISRYLFVAGDQAARYEQDGNLSALLELLLVQRSYLTREIQELQTRGARLPRRNGFGKREAVLG